MHMCNKWIYLLTTDLNRDYRREVELVHRMTRQVLGSGNDERPPTPTLREYVEIHENDVPLTSHVKIIFFPTKVPNYSLITDHDFRVNIHRNSPLFQLFLDSLAEWEASGIVLQVMPDRGSPGAFSLALEDGRVCDWEPKPWGYKLGEDRKRPKPTGAKVTRPGMAGTSETTDEG